MNRLVVCLALLGVVLSKPLLDFKDPDVAKEVADQCNVIFEARKDEINAGLVKLQKRQNVIDMLSNENSKLLKQKQDKLDAQEKILKQMYSDMKAEEIAIKRDADEKLKQAKAMLAKNEDLLKQIKGEKETKLSQSYAKMKDTAAAQIISGLSSEDAIDILLKLQPKQIGLILSKMAPKKAAELTELLQYYPDKKPRPTPASDDSDSGSADASDAPSPASPSQPPASSSGGRPYRGQSPDPVVRGGYTVY